MNACLPGCVCNATPKSLSPPGYISDIPEELGTQAGESRRGTTQPKERNQGGLPGGQAQPELSPNMLTEHLLSTLAWISVEEPIFEAEVKGVCVGRRVGVEAVLKAGVWGGAQNSGR